MSVNGALANRAPERREIAIATSRSNESVRNLGVIIGSWNGCDELI